MPRGLSKAAPASSNEQRSSNSSSSHALVTANLIQQQSYADLTQIPMQDLNSDAKPRVHQHDPLPPAVDFSQVSPSTHYQFRALARRALSYHRRQRFTNICCLVIWPLLLVIFCFVITLLSREDLEGYKGPVAFCVNEVDPLNNSGFSLGNVPEPTGGRTKPAAAWYPSTFSKDHYSSKRLPCVRWFGETYPIKAPYENVTAADMAQPDSFYTPPPRGGWFNLREIIKAYKREHPNASYETQPAIWEMDNVNQTVYYLTANAQIAQTLGTIPNVTRSFFTERWPPTDPRVVYNITSPGVTPGTGLLGAIPVRYSNRMRYGNLDSDGRPISGDEEKFSAQNFIQMQDQASIDKTIQNMIHDIAKKNTMNMYEDMPFGAMLFDALDPAKSSIKMTMQFGQPPSGEYSYGARETTPAGLRQIIAMTQMTNAMIKTKYAGQYVISQGLRALPFEWDNNILKGTALNTVSLVLFPFALSFLMPTFVSILVQEKEDRHRMMMAMNGLKSSSYYLAHYFEFMTMQLILSLFFCLACAVISSQVVHRTNPLIIIVLLVIWAHIQTTLAFAISACFSNTRRATLIVYFVVAVSCILGAATELIFKDGTPFAWYIHPSFSFFSILNKAIVHASRVNGLYPLTWADFAAGTTLFKCLMLLLGESILFMILTFYIDAVAPSEYGVQKPWHFPISSLFRKRRPSAAAARDPESRLANDHNANADHSNDTLEGGDADVYAERDRVRTQYDPATTPLIINNLFHSYSGKVEPALKGMSFGVETNTVLGLLGPNGAGKSTMIHLLTGLYSPTSGTAHVAGANIRTDMAIVHAKIGVCPQHDILWGDLTVADHLLFYSRLRGIPPSLEQRAVAYAIASVSLTAFRDRQVKGLSGGERRRVSIAIALLGDNSVIFLDEPSTGLDPAVRRVIWDIINRVKVNRTVVLTTHSMEEADILSDRIAIMTSGRLRCIGSSLHLKELYGTGFRLNVSSKPGRLEEACQGVEGQILKGMQFRRIDKFTNATTFEFDLQSQAGRGQLSKIFSLLSQPGLFPAIEDWGISQTTLEDVFIKIVTEGDSALEMPTIVAP
ncbi:hypothetical protein BGZ51_002361 [Haplosporangium sp. Z 767]|nr:hypothetical protein BGZ50_002823 [Haplosporangium sp. Z 11]KAF9193697.1 hypothetical protein BGZ51_002361 [Haplosporangium sp. Z 767]